MPLWTVCWFLISVPDKSRWGGANVLVSPPLWKVRGYIHRPYSTHSKRHPWWQQNNLQLQLPHFNCSFLKSCNLPCLLDMICEVAGGNPSLYHSFLDDVFIILNHDRGDPRPITWQRQWWEGEKKDAERDGIDHTCHFPVTLISCWCCGKM